MSTLDHRIRLANGRLLDPFAADPFEGQPPTDFPTAARAASMLCRYGGHVTRFLSVGEHTLWVLVQVMARGEEGVARDLRDALVARTPRWGAMLVRLTAADDVLMFAGLAALGHDILSEGQGLGDMLGPIKRRPEMAAYREAELRLLRAHFTALGLPPPPIPAGYCECGSRCVTIARDPASRDLRCEREVAEYLGLRLVEVARPAPTAQDMCVCPACEPEQMTAADSLAWRAWSPVWAADGEIYGSELSLRPWATGGGLNEAQSAWPWLCLDTTVLDDGGMTTGSIGRPWVVRALVEAWHALSACVDSRGARMEVLP